MSFKTKQRVFTFLFCGGACVIGAGLGFYQSEELAFVLCAVLCLIGGIMMVAALIFMHLRMRCSVCHRTYPLGWWGVRCSPRCGEYFD